MSVHHPPSVIVTHRQLRLIEARLQTARAYLVEAQALLQPTLFTSPPGVEAEAAPRLLEASDKALLEAVALVREATTAPAR